MDPLEVEIVKKLNVAFNEATLLGIELNQKKRILALTLSVICLNSDGSIPADKRVQVLLRPVGRIMASLRNAAWNDKEAKAVSFTPEQFLEISRNYGREPIYGWQFFDCEDTHTDEWRNRLSMQFESGTDGLKHTLDLSQDKVNSILNIRIWFDSIAFYTRSYAEIAINDFIQAGERAWVAIMNGNEYAQKAFNISPLKQRSKS